VEVLIRYLEEEKNCLPPGGFFDVLESLKLIGVLDRWVIGRIVRSLVGHHEAHKNWNVPRYSINLSVDSLLDPGFCKQVADTLRKSGLPPGKLKFEIGEADAEANLEAVGRLSAAVSPFGCGLTLTAYKGRLLPPGSLRRIGVDSVKINSDGVCDCDLNYTVGHAQAIQLACAREKVKTIAEMVEGTEVLEAVRQLGFDYAQGYAVGAPVPLHALDSLAQ
jgi:EAL domain-containing protein (putative c-di-GMP-specific phosphodiesterase class I)